MTRLLLALLLPLIFRPSAIEAAAPASGTTDKPDTGKLAALNAALAPLHARYDPDEHMLREPFHSPGYHTTLKGGFVHPTRNSLNYAVGLLDTGDPALLKRAEQILKKVISLQDQRPESRTYGIWSWFLEEPLDKMSPPDWNWADFCGAALLQVARDHKDRLSPEVARLVDTAIEHAARSIQRRNVGPGYTNIAIMGSYVTLIAAELYGWPDLLEYARARWQRFYDYTMSEGAFTEYNSPTYSIVALRELARMRAHVRDPKCRQMAEELYRFAWEDIAKHFHAPTRQWAGPHSRAYRTLLGSDTLALIQHATGNRANFAATNPNISELRVPLDCPREFESYFVRLESPRELRRTFQKGKLPIVGTTYLTPEFALGSINVGDLWNQRRPLLAYWGTAENPRYLRVRFLHDDYDFSAAQFFSTQKGGDVLAGIAFATDGGDTHVSLDRLKDGKFSARDLRLRFEFGGAARALPVAIPETVHEPVRLRDGAVSIKLTALSRFGSYTPKWQVGKDAETAWLDLVLFSGPQQQLRLGDLGPAVLGMALSMSHAPEFRAVIDDQEMVMTMGKLQLTIPSRPSTVSDLRKTFR